MVGSDELDDLICILARTFCSYLDETERNMAKSRQNQCTTRPERQWVGKRRQQRTPPEELDYKREAKFQKIEEKVISQAEKDDSSYMT